MSEHHFVYCSTCGRLVAVVDDHAVLVRRGGIFHRQHLGDMPLGRDRLRVLIKTGKCRVETQLVLA